MTGLSSSCGACKFLRRKCTNQCVFAPYFSYDEAASHFAAVHKVFGASNVSKLLLHLPLHNRNDAAISIAYEALERMRDPTYGCVAHIFALQQEVASLQVEIEILGNQIANFGAGSGSSRPEAKNPINIEFQQLHDSIMNIDNSQNQLNPELLYQTFNGQTDTQISPSSFALGDQDQLLGACNLVGGSPFDVVGMALENFACYPWWENTV